MTGTARVRKLRTMSFVVLLAFGLAASGAAAGPAVDALEGRWTPTDCSDPATGTWSVFGNQIQFFWPTSRANDALENVISESDSVVETEVVSPDNLKGRRYRYRLRGPDEVLIEDLNGGKAVAVRRCAG